jgi:hypothetical protein
MQSRRTVIRSYRNSPEQVESSNEAMSVRDASKTSALITFALCVGCASSASPPPPLSPADVSKTWLQLYVPEANGSEGVIETPQGYFALTRQFAPSEITATSIVRTTAFAGIRLSVTGASSCSVFAESHTAKVASSWPVPAERATSFCLHIRFYAI